MSIYGFWQGPAYRPSTRDELFTAALDMPMSAGATFWDQAKGGVLESFGLGTTIREMTLPPSAPGRWYGDTDQSYADRRKDYKTITEEEYKASPYYRDNVPWDNGMTEDRAAALATMNDAKRVREYFAEKRPITSFFGNLAGQATDPINYIPVVGPSVKAAAVARMGVVKGIAATAALDAAANTAIAGLATRETRRSFGDDVSWQAMVSEIATAALLGTAFGTVGGLLERRAGNRADALRSEAEVKVNTLRATQEARIALNEAIGGLANDGEVRLSPNGVAPIERMARDVEIASPTRVIDLEADNPVAIQDAKAKLEAYDYNIPAMQEAGVDIPRVMADAPELDAARALQRQEIGAVTERVKTLASEPELRNEFGPGMRRTEAATAEAPVFDAGMGSVRTLDAQRAEIASETARLARLQEFDARGEVEPSVLEQIRIGRQINAPRPSRPIDASPARPEPPPTGRAEAEAKVAKPENYKALADQYRVDPEAGTFPEEAELRQLAQEGRLSDNDMAVMDAADETFQDGAAFGEALKTAVNCLL